MIKNDKTMLIDKYITGKIEDTELWEFKTKIDQDADLAREVELRREIYNAISNEHKMELMTTLSNIKGRKDRRIFSINIYSRQVQALAASIIVLFVVGAGLLSNFAGSGIESNYEIYNSYFVDEGSLISNRSDATNNSLVESGITLFENGNYTEAVSTFNSNPENVLARLYCGLSYMKLDQFNEAEKQFKYIINHHDNIFIDQAEWNLGLSYLANDKTEQASVIFAKIASEKGAYNTQASNLIKTLENK